MPSLFLFVHAKLTPEEFSVAVECDTHDRAPSHFAEDLSDAVHGYSSVALGKHRAWAPALHHLFDAADRARVLTVYLLGQRFGCPSEICERIAANFQAAPAEFGVTTIARLQGVGVGGGVGGGVGVGGGL